MDRTEHSKDLTYFSSHKKQNIYARVCVLYEERHTRSSACDYPYVAKELPGDIRKIQGWYTETIFLLGTDGH